MEGHPPQATEEAENADVRQTAGVESGTSEAIDCIGEIFHHARQRLAADDSRRAEDFVDWQALETALEEPWPLFIRDGGQLKRRAA